MYANLNDLTGQELITGLDNVVIVQNEWSLPGGRTLDVSGYAGKVIKAGHVIIKETSTGNYKPMPATEARKAGAATVGTLVAGTGYTNGVYENVPLVNASQNSTGKGFLGTVTVAGTVVTGVTVGNSGSGYKVGDVLQIPAVYAGGTGAGASVTVATVADVAGAYGALPAGHTYEHILIQTIAREFPFAGLLVKGVVNPNAAPFPMGTILAAVKAALTFIYFKED